jgi:hypothetical protein
MTPISPNYTRADLIAMIHQRDMLVYDLKEARAAAYAQGIEDANQMVGALWSDLFNKDLIKAAGANYFDQWRDRIKELAKPKRHTVSGSDAADDDDL